MCIESIAGYLLLLKEKGDPMPIIAISVGFPNLYKDESMCKVYASQALETLTRSARSGTVTLHLKVTFPSGSVKPFDLFLVFADQSSWLARWEEFVTV